jgi:FKBP-type peptidyl-prolyl cis-trans isomerase
MMMKIHIPLALLAVFTLSACEQKVATEAAPESGSTAADSAAALDTAEKRLSYGIAFGLGQRLQQDGVPLDVAAFSEGLSHAFEGREPVLTQEQIGAELQAFQAQQGAQREAEMAAVGESNAAAGAAFLAENGQQEGVVTLENGLQYKIIEAGEGAVPGAADTVEVHYRGTLLDGTEFDSSYSRGQSVSFGVSQVIPGWTEALQLMPVGSKWQLFIPAELAYGPAGAGGQIGPNATLIFDVELLDIVSTGAEEAEQAQ